MVCLTLAGCPASSTPGELAPPTVVDTTILSSVGSADGGGSAAESGGGSAPEGGAKSADGGAPRRALTERAGPVELARRLAEVSGSPVALTEAAEEVAGCLTFDVPAEAGPTPGVEARLRAALGASPLRLGEATGGAGLQVDLDPEVLLLACQPRHPPEPLAADELEGLRRQVRRLPSGEREVPVAALRALARLSRGAPESSRLAPYYREGELLGLKLYTDGDGGLPGLLGLREGDLLTHAAGRSLSAPDVVVPLPASGQPLVLRVQRDGEPLELRYRVVTREPAR